MTTTNEIIAPEHLAYVRQLNDALAAARAELADAEARLASMVEQSDADYKALADALRWARNLAPAKRPPSDAVTTILAKLADANARANGADQRANAYLRERDEARAALERASDEGHSQATVAALTVIEGRAQWQPFAEALAKRDARVRAEARREVLAGMRFDCTRPTPDGSACHCCQRRMLRLATAPEAPKPASAVCGDWASECDAGCAHVRDGLRTAPCAYECVFASVRAKERP